MSHDHLMNNSMSSATHPPEHHHSTAALGHDHGSGMTMMVSGNVTVNQRAFPCLGFRVTYHLNDYASENRKLNLALEGMNQSS